MLLFNRDARTFASIYFCSLISMNEAIYAALQAADKDALIFDLIFCHECIKVFIMCDFLVKFINEDFEGV